MKMTPLNISIFVIALIGGLYLGFAYPLFAILLLIPVLGFVAIIFMRNKSGAAADASALNEALQFSAPANKSRIYVMRKGFVGGQQGMNITVDGTLESQIRSKYFLMAEVEPGKHSVKAKMSSGSESAARTHDVDVAAGECVLLDMKLNMGALQGTPDFTEERDAAQAKQMLSGCKLILWKDAAREPATVSQR